MPETVARGDACCADARREMIADVQKVLDAARRIRNTRKYRPDCSIFSALNIDVVRAPVSDWQRKPCEHDLLVTGLTVVMPGMEDMLRSGRLPGTLDDKDRPRGTGNCKNLVSSSEETTTPGSDVEASSSSDSTEGLPLSPAVTPADRSTGSGQEFLESRKCLLTHRLVAGSRGRPAALEGFSARAYGASPPLMAQRRAPAMLETLFDAFSTSPLSSGKSSGVRRKGSEASLSTEASTPAWRSPNMGAGTPCSSPWTPSFKRCPQDDLRRNLQSLLNKVCPENVATIAEKIACIRLDCAKELEVIIELIFKKAVTEPHYCETYADLVFALKAVFPEFPASDAAAKPVTFRSAVLNICQHEFEDLLTSIDSDKAEDVMDVRKRRKDRLIANMKFIGHLYLRQLLSVRVVGSVSRELVGCDSDAGDYPEEHALECACELLMAIGFTLEANPAGNAAMKEIVGRLGDLKRARTTEGKAVYSKRVQFLVQDLLDTRSAGWTKRSFKTSAKTKEEIRQEQQRDMLAVARGNSMAKAEISLAGQRPGYLAPATAA